MAKMFLFSAKGQSGGEMMQAFSVSSYSLPVNLPTKRRTPDELSLMV